MLKTPPQKPATPPMIAYCGCEDDGGYGGSDSNDCNSDVVVMVMLAVMMIMVIELRP